MRHIYTSVDIGSDTMKVIVCELYKGKLNLLAATSVKSSGIKKGLITDIDASTVALKKAISEIEAMLGVRIEKVIATVPSYFSEYSVVKSTVEIKSEGGMVTGSDITNGLQQAAHKQLEPGKEIVTILPIDFVVDEQARVKDPKGLIGKELTTRAVMVTTPKKNIYSVATLLDRAGLEFVDISLNPIGDIYAFKTKEMDQQIGTVINIGAETTTVSLYNKGVLVKCSTIAVGSKHVDKDLMYTYKVDSSIARNLKEKFVVAHKKYASNSSVYEIDDDELGSLKINQFDASEVVMSRLEEILQLANNEIKSLTDHEIQYTIVTGGITNMVHFDDLVLETLGEKATVGSVKLVGLRNNKYSVCIGNIVYFINKLKLKGKEYSMISDEDMENHRNKSSFMNNISNENMLGKLFNYFFSE